MVSGVPPVSLCSPPHLLALLLSARVCPPLSGCLLRLRARALQVPLAPLPSAPSFAWLAGPPSARLRFACFPRIVTAGGLVRVRSAHTLYSPFRPPAFARLCCAVSCRQKPSRQALPAPQTLTAAVLHDVTQLSQSSTRVLRTYISLISIIINQIHSNKFHI